jgi:hypothetical protein
MPARAFTGARGAVLLLLLLLLASLLLPATALAVDGRVTFDSLTPGQSYEGAIDSGNPTFVLASPGIVYQPTINSMPGDLAMRAPTGCPIVVICNVARIQFARPMTQVEMNIGFGGMPDNTVSELGTYASIRAYDAEGREVAATTNVPLFGRSNGIPVADGVSHALDTPRLPRPVIREVRIWVGASPFGSLTDSGPRAWEIDDVMYTDRAGRASSEGPTINITWPQAPEDRVFADPSDVRVSGSVRGINTVSAFCISVDQTTTMPAGVACDRANSLAPGDLLSSRAFRGVAIPEDRLLPGTRTLTAWVRDGLGNVASDTVSVRILGLQSDNLDIGINEMTVLQAAQDAGEWINAATIDRMGSSARAVPSGLPAPSRVWQYNGVGFVPDKPAVVQLMPFITAGRNRPDAAEIAAVTRRATITLRGYQRGEGGRYEELPGGPVTPIPQTRVPFVAGEIDSGWLRRESGVLMNRRGAYVMRLPDAWTYLADELTLVAEVNPSDARPRIVEDVCDTCQRNNRIIVQDIPIYRQRGIEVVPVEVFMARDDNSGFVRPAADAPSHFGAYRAMAPIGNGDLSVWPRFAGAVEYTGWARNTTWTMPQVNARVLDRIARMADDNDWDEGERELASGEDDPDPKVIGIGPNDRLRATPPVAARLGGLARGAGGYGETGRFAVATEDRPVTLVAHELMHLQGLVHAAAACGAEDDSNGEVDRRWPRPMGQTNSLGWDSRVDMAPGTSRAFRTDGSAFADPAEFSNVTTEFDVMSYCTRGNDAVSWLSALNYRRLLSWYHVRDRLPSPPTPPGEIDLRADAATSRRVAFTANSDTSAQFLSVFSSDESPVAAVTSGTSAKYGVRTMAGKANALGTYPATCERQHDLVSEKAGDVDVLACVARVPVEGDALELVNLADANASFLARRDASANQPVVTLTSPVPGQSIEDGKDLRVAWTASDADGNELEPTVSFSPRGTAAYRAIGAGLPAGESMLLDSNLLTRSDDACVRVTINDGFNETSSSVCGLKVAGHAPNVSVISAQPGVIDTQADVPVTFHAAAMDDAGTRLKGASIEWLVDGKLTGATGIALRRRLGPGRHTVAARATDQLGRTATTSRTVKVAAVPPIATSWSQRLVLARGAGGGAGNQRAKATRLGRHVVIRLRTNVDCVVTINGRASSVRAGTLRTIRVDVSERGAVAPLLVRLDAGSLATSFRSPVGAGPKAGK